MRVVITGHTGGLGLAFFNYFTERGDEVVGLSRSNGYALPDKLDQIAEIASTADLFINNVHCRLTQATLIEKLYDKVSIVTSGSIAGDYPSKIDLYSRDKEVIYKVHRTYKKKGQLPMLFLKMGYLENFTQYESIPYQQIINGLDFWLKNPRCSEIEFDNVFYQNNFVKPITK